MKMLHIRCLSDHSVTMHLDIRGEKTVTAGDINAPSNVEIVNPDLYIATLDNADAHLDMEITVDRGIGYRPADQNGVQLSIGVIPIDSIFTPVTKVNYVVEQMLVNDLADYERVLLDITTNGTTNPDSTLRQAADILVQLFSLVASYELTPAISPTETYAPSSTIPIPEYIYDVLTMDEAELRSIRNFGEKSLVELGDRLRSRHFFPQTLPNNYALTETLSSVGEG